MKRINFFLKTALLTVFFISCASNNVSVSSVKDLKNTDTVSVKDEEKITDDTVIIQKDTTPLINNILPDTKIELLDDFEEGNFWSSELSSEFYKNINLSYGTQLSKEWASEKDNSGKWSFKECSGNKDNAYFCCNQLLYTDWTDAKALVCDINNQCSSSVEITFAAISGPGVWSQTSKNIKLGCGINTNVLFDLVNGTTDLQENAIPGFADIDSVCCAVFVIYGKNKGGDIYVDNIRLLY